MQFEGEGHFRLFYKHIAARGERCLFRQMLICTRFSTDFGSIGASDPLHRGWRPGTSGRSLLSGTSPRPIQCQCCVLGVSQPLCDLPCLERALFEVQLTIEQFCDFFRSAWFPNLVQRSQDVLAETTSRIRNLLHRWFQRPEELTG